MRTRDAVTKLTDLSQSLHSALDSYKSADQTVNARAMAQAEIKADLAITKAGGSLSDDMVASLKKALTSVTQDSSDQFSSYTDYLRDMYETQNDISGLASVTDSSLSVEQQALDAAKAQITAMDAVVSKAQEQVDVLKGQSVIASVDRSSHPGARFGDSVGRRESGQCRDQRRRPGVPGGTRPRAGCGRARVLAAAGRGGGVRRCDIQSAITMSPEATIQGMYQTMLHRAADSAGMQYWLTQANNGVSLADIGNAIASSAELTGQTADVPPPASVSNDSDAVVAALQRVEARLASIESSSGKTADATTQHAQQFDQVSAGGSALLTETA